jgi:hypothetical protein
MEKLDHNAANENEALKSKIIIMLIKNNNNKDNNFQRTKFFINERKLEVLIIGSWFIFFRHDICQKKNRDQCQNVEISVTRIEYFL